MSISPVSGAASSMVSESAAAKPAAASAAPAQPNIGPAVHVTLSNASSGDTDHDGDSK